MLASLTARANALVPFAAATTHGMLAVLAALVSLIDFGHSGLFELGVMPSVALVTAVAFLLVAAVGAARLTGSPEGARTFQRIVAIAVATALVGVGPLAAVAVQAAYSAMHPDSLPLLSPPAAMLAVGLLAAATLVGAPAAAVFGYKAHRSAPAAAHSA